MFIISISMAVDWMERVELETRARDIRITICPVSSWFFFVFGAPMISSINVDGPIAPGSSSGMGNRWYTTLKDHAYTMWEVFLMSTLKFLTHSVYAAPDTICFMPA